MYIYKEREDRVDIYRFEPNKQRIKEYRESIAQKHPIFFVDLQTNNCESISEIYKGVTSLDSIDYLSGKNFSDIYFNLAESSRKSRGKERSAILENYINGKFDLIKPVMITESINEKVSPLYFFLVTSDVETLEINKGCWYRIENIIVLPRELYLLGLLFSGNTQELTEEEFQTLMGLGISYFVKSVETPKEAHSFGYISRDSFRVKEKSIRRSLKKYGQL